MSENLFSAFTAAATADRAKPFIERPDASLITYQDMETDTARIANILSAMGLGPDDRVAVQVDKSAEALLVYLACLRLGAVYIPFNPAYMIAELRYLLADAEPKLFICSPGRFAESAKLADELGLDHIRTLGTSRDGTLLEKLGHAETSFADQSRHGDDLAAILYTSGTTGRSKGAMLSHANLASNARTLKDFWCFTSEDRLLHALPIFHTHGLFVATNTIAAAGASMRSPRRGGCCRAPP